MYKEIQELYTPNQTESLLRTLFQNEFTFLFYIFILGHSKQNVYYQICLLALPFCAK